MRSKLMVPIAREPHGLRVARSWASKRKERKEVGNHGLIWIGAMTATYGKANRPTDHEDVGCAWKITRVAKKYGRKTRSDTAIR